LGNDEGQFAETCGTDDKLAKDVARLYSWANVEDAAYHDFSRRKRIRHKPVAQTDPSRERENPESSGKSAEAPETPPPPPELLVATAPEAAVAYLVPCEETHGWTEPMTLWPQVQAEEKTAAPLAEIATREFAELTPNARRDSAQPDRFRPVVAIYSLAGGVGKTTLCANLGRALCTSGDRVSLIDASGSGMLSFYFGASDLRPGVHTFISPGAFRAPLRVLDSEMISADWLADEVQSEIDSSDWVLFDLGQASTSLLPKIFSMCSVMVVPLLPELNSILTISRLESTLQAIRLGGVEVPTPFYLFNQYDPADPIDQGARDLVLRQCGGRLLPFSIGEDDQAAAAIAARKTVIDHAPGSEIAIACVRLAALLRTAATSNRSRWSPRSCAEI